MYRKNLAILGSTGSIGEQTLDVAANHSDEFNIFAIAANRNIDRLQQQAFQYRPAFVGTSDEFSTAPSLPEGTQFARGARMLIDFATHPDVDMVVIATSGTIGLAATLAALKAGKEVALANKETLVIGGELVMKTARENGKEIRPIDSEHSALWQCLRGEKSDQIKNLWLCASGGPFRSWTMDQVKQATPAQALKHPNWSMGKKITIDSASLMNKGLEVIEAHWLFHQPYEKIKVILQPQSIIHSMVEYADGSTKAQISLPDMRLAIQYALTYPDRIPAHYPYLDWSKINQLTFELPDHDRFPSLGIALEAGRLGGTFPAVLVAADEILVDLFLLEKISFFDIPYITRDILAAHARLELTLENIYEAMTWTFREIEKITHSSSYQSALLNDLIAIS